MNIFKSFFKSRDKPRNAAVGTGWFHVDCSRSRMNATSEITERIYSDSGQGVVEKDESLEDTQNAGVFDATGG